jgi:hypothetical protein
MRIIPRQGALASQRPPPLGGSTTSQSTLPDYQRVLLEDDEDIELDAEMLAVLENLPAVAAARVQGGRKLVRQMAFAAVL